MSEKNRNYRQSSYQNYHQDFVPDQNANEYEIENEEWNPTPEALNHFFTRDAELASENIRTLLQNSRTPMSVRDIKESCLHSTDLIERTLSAWVKKSYLLEVKGKYDLNPAYKGYGVL